jgi:NAD(P)-dependent dehydrogenase (short-subunit alcohol dehydrogenase family)
MSIVEVLNELRQTNITPTIHKAPYDAIAPTRPELRQAERTILITGGGTGAGFAIAQAFIRALASTIVIVGRRTQVLQAAQSRLCAAAQAAGTNTKIITRQCDVSKEAEIDTLWKWFDGERIVVDVYVANAAAFSEPVGMLDLGVKKVWEMMETNSKGPMEMAERFVKQPNTDGRQKASIGSSLSQTSCTNGGI